MSNFSVVWLLHSAQVSTLSPLYYSWHLTGVFIANITITADSPAELAGRHLHPFLI